MKKSKILLLVILLILLCKTINVFAKQVEDSLYIYDFEDSIGESSVYNYADKYDYVNYISMDAYTFDSFVKNPQEFENISDGKGATLYSLFYISNENIIYSAKINNVFYENIDKGESSRVIWNYIETGSYNNLLSKQTFEYLNSDNIDNILKSHDINASASDIYLVNVEGEAYSYFPALIWIKDNDNENHFLVFDGNGGDTAYCDFDVEKLDYMNYNEFYKKYAIRKGVIYINGVNIETDKLMFQANNYMYVPFRDLVEGFGSVVIWNQENRSVSFNCDGINYTLYNDLSGLSHNYKKEGVLNYYNLTPFIDNTMYVNRDVLYRIADMFGMNCDVDFENNTVYLNSR